MISFIVCDDKKLRVDGIESHIKNEMKEHRDINYTLNHFSGYGKGFLKCELDKNAFKVFFLDIETKLGSGMDEARKIRELYDDWNSIIIIETVHEEERFSAENSRLYIFDFLDKNNNFYNLLDDDLKKIIKIYSKSSKYMMATSKDKITKVELRDIVYIEKDVDSRSCTIHTLNEDIKTSYGINKCLEQLDENFIMASRSAIINIKMIKEYNYKENEIKFMNDLKMNNISRENKRKIRDYARKIN